ncbi:hypothetical protein C0992_005897 [Termitomyces sp. T32_za158]|nr:hypothetical protein C0992_005897 [Termitomyces sp. T32_za158]
MQRRTFVSIIQQGHEGWRLTLGRNPVKLEPGLNLAIPIFHEVLVMDMRESSIAIPDLTGYTLDNVPVTCSGSLFYRVTNGYKLEAKSNEADAFFKTVVREAEARQKQALLEASALASQVEELARSIAKDKDNILPEERQRALASLIEIRRLDQLKAIAQSKSNSTYFFGDQAALGRGNDMYNIDYAEHVKGGLASKPVVSRPEVALPA